VADATFRTLERHTFVSGLGRNLHVYGELRGRLTDDEPPAAEPVALHQRLDVLTDTWVAISPARNVRPHVRLPGPGGAASAACPLCPGGVEVPFGYDAAVFDNRFPTFVPDPPPIHGPGLLPGDPRIGPSIGRCEVVLYSERHEGSLATLSPVELARLLAVWRDRSADLWADPRHRFVLIFENHGEIVGATLSHPHGQIYAFDRLPQLIAMRVGALERHRRTAGACLACEVAASDSSSGRVVARNGTFVVAQPFAPRWPYEVHVRARRHGVRRLTDLRPDEQRDLARALRQVVLRYDGLFGFELPYMMEIMEAPEGQDDWHLAVEFLPPHRNAKLTKVRASVETQAGTFINDTLPEETARELAAIELADRAEAPAMRSVTSGVSMASAGSS
jgi:UDPglucose--hexose-1-phosphate uridylyltransferase